MDYKEYINANKLLDLRSKKGIRQQDLADKLGMCVTDRISHWEKGTAIPSIINLFRLCAVHEVLPHELYPELFEKIVSETHGKQNIPI